MVCPACHAGGSRRSRRRSVIDYVFAAVGMVPWRCVQCEKRFHARSVALRNVRYARCAICGNLELQKISPQYVAGPLSFFARLLELPALRCDPCRHKFFSMRPVLRESARLSSSSRDQAA
jgi:DNA-directed RNA polymerase subunit RPC12/RpoP